MDVSTAYQFARGAMWHSEIATAQLEAAALGSPALEVYSRGHVHAALNDFDAVVGAGVIDTPPHDVRHAVNVLRSSTLRADEAVPALSLVAHHARTMTRQLGESSPHLGASPLELSLGGSLPERERAAVITAASARRMNQVSATMRDQRLELLRVGQQYGDPVKWIGGFGNSNGGMPIVRVRHAGEEALAVNRPLHAEPIQEAFHYRGAVDARVDHLFSPTSLRADGTAMVELSPGKPAWDPSQNIRDDSDERSTIEHGYRLKYPNLPESDVVAAARTDQEVRAYLDYRNANCDRNLGSLVADREHGRIHLFDGGEISNGELQDVTRPAQKDKLAIGWNGEVSVSSLTRESIRATDTDRALNAQHAILRAPLTDTTRASMSAEDVAQLEHARHPGLLAALRTRRDAVLDTGVFRYQPIAEESNPAWAVRDLLGGQTHSWK